MDEMWSFYHDKGHQIWLWWAMGHDTGEAVAFWFGSREHGHLDKLLALLAPLNIEKVYADGNYAYYERVCGSVGGLEATLAKNRTQAFIVTDVV